MNWQELIGALAHGEGQETELATQLADLEAWPTPQLSELFTVVIPDYHKALKANESGEDHVTRAEGANRLLRMATAAQTELAAREARSAADAAELNDASSALDGVLGTDNDDDPPADPPNDDDAPPPADPPNEDPPADPPPADQASDTPPADPPADPPPADTPPADQAGGTPYEFGTRPTPTPGQLNDQQNKDGDAPPADPPANEPGFNINRLGTGEQLDVWSDDYYDGVESSGMQIVDQGLSRVKGSKVGDEWSSVEQYAAAIANHHNKSGQQTAARWQPQMGANTRVQDKQSFGFMETKFANPLKPGMDFDTQHAIIDGVVKAARRSPAMVADASGGCAVPPFTPRREFMRCAVPFAPVRGTLPVINVEDEGGMKWMKPPDWRAAKAGIQLTTAAQNAAGYGAPAQLDPETGEEISPSTIPEGGAPFKACMRMPCPTWYEACVDMLSVCVIFDNLQKRVWPGLVQNFLQDVEMCVDAILEQYFLTGIDATSEPVVGMQNYYGATRTMLADAKIMRRNLIESEHMGENQVVNWYVPSWALDQICIDLINNNQFGMEFFFNYSVGDIAARLRTQYHINLIPYRDSAVNCVGEPRNQQIQSITVDPASGDFCLKQLPRNPITYMHLPGTYAVLDGGSFETGYYRDSILNKTNDCALFSELWLEIVKLGCTSLVAVHDLCPTGTGAGPRDPFDCATFPTWIPPESLTSESVGQMALCLPGGEPILYGAGA